MADELKPVYLLSGSDRPKVTRALQRLRARFAEGAAEYLIASEASGEDAVAACNALGLFADEGRLVLVEEVDVWKAADAKAIAAYLASPAPATVLALVGEEVKKDSPLAKASAQAGEVLVYDVAKRDLPSWVAEQFKRVEAKADAAACRALVELVGDNPEELAGEVEKIAVWAAGKEIGERDVELLVAPRAEVPPWALTDAWGHRDVAAVLTACEAALLQGRTVTGLVWTIADHIRLVRACHAFAAEGIPPSEAAKRLRKREFPVKKAYAQADAIPDEELRAALVRLAELEVAVKGGSRLPDELELERALVEITAPARAGA